MTGKEIKIAFIAIHKDYAENLEEKETTTEECTFCLLDDKIADPKAGKCKYCTMNNHQGFSCAKMLTYIANPFKNAETKTNGIILRKQFHKRAAEILELITPKAFLNSMDKIGKLLHQIDQEIYYENQRLNK